MQALVTLISPFVSIVAHGAGPQHLPRSGFLLGIVVLCHVALFTGGMMLLDATPARTYLLPLMNVVIQTSFFSGLLLLLGLGERLLQTLTAVFGADFLLNLLSIPLALVDAAGSDSPVSVISTLAALLVLLWSLGVKGHILRNVTGFPYYVGVVIALGFFVTHLALDVSLFGVPA